MVSSTSSDILLVLNALGATILVLALAEDATLGSSVKLLDVGLVSEALFRCAAEILLCHVFLLVPNAMNDAPALYVFIPFPYSTAEQIDVEHVQAIHAESTKSLAMYINTSDLEADRLALASHLLSPSQLMNKYTTLFTIMQLNSRSAAMPNYSESIQEQASTCPQIPAFIGICEAS